MEDAMLVHDWKNPVLLVARDGSRGQLRADELRRQRLGRRPARRGALAQARFLLGSEFDLDGHGGARSPTIRVAQEGSAAQKLRPRLCCDGLSPRSDHVT